MPACDEDTHNWRQITIRRKLFETVKASVDCLYSSLYWSDLGAVAKIERSRLDGTHRAIFIDKDIDKPIGLSVDYAARRLYWVDDFRDTIESADLLTGQHRRFILVRPEVAATPKLFGLSVFQVSRRRNAAVYSAKAGHVYVSVGLLTGLSTESLETLRINFRDHYWHADSVSQEKNLFDFWVDTDSNSAMFLLLLIEFILWKLHPSSHAVQFYSASALAMQMRRTC